MSIASVKSALEVAVKAGLGTFPIGWENVSYQPPSDGAAWVGVTFLPATPENPTMGDQFHRDVGIMQLMLSYPLDGGSGKAYAKAQAIRELFPRGSSYTSGGYTVHIAKTAQIGPGFRTDDRFLLPVRLQFFANIFD